MDSCSGRHGKRQRGVGWLVCPGVGMRGRVVVRHGCAGRRCAGALGVREARIWRLDVAQRLGLPRSGEKRTRRCSASAIGPELLRASGALSGSLWHAISMLRKGESDVVLARREGGR